jgi:chaperonin GroEL (HSP60 family)
MSTNKKPEDMSTNEGRKFEKDPAINVISKEEFEVRIEKVFHLLWKTLSKSFGPYGAPTLIYNYPWSHVTKDGYTIMKNLSMNASETYVDQAIADMAADICGRLNYSVGDGTTSAVIATNSIYQQYRARKNELESMALLPRDIIKAFNEIKDNVINELQKKVVPIKSDNPDELYENIRKVVYISSNGDDQMSDYIADLYRELNCPAISCVLASDGITKKRMIEGYKLDMTLTDKLYINSDNNVMALDEADIIIFATRITRSIYEDILVPLNNHVRQLGRHLIVAAPSYDETALSQVISRDLTNEFQEKKDINMVLCSYKASSAHSRRIIEDFAMLTNTIVIDSSIVRSLKSEIENGKPIYEVFNIHSRDINGLRCMAVSDDPTRPPCRFTNGNDVLPDDYHTPELIEHYITLGYLKSIKLGLKFTTASGFCYDEDRYNAVRKDAEQIMKETEAKYQKLGTFNLEVSQAQQRYYALNLKMGIIEVGGDTELSQKLLKDAVDDAVKAAASAFDHGVVMGCNIDLITTLREIIDSTDDNTEKLLCKILEAGFMDVYRTVLSNAYPNVDFSFDGKAEISKEHFNATVLRKYFPSVEELNICLADMQRRRTDVPFDTSLYDMIIEYSIMHHKVFDVSDMNFTSDVVNSLQTDEEILKATIDLIALLITGNQMVVTQKHNF